MLLFPLILAAPEWLGLLKTDPRLLSSTLGVGLRAGLFQANPGFLDPNSAWTLQALGHLAAEQWLSGQVPWWNPLSGVGAPLAAEMQPAPLFLPFVLLLHFEWGWLALHICMQAIAGVGMWALLRRLGLVPAVCLAGGALAAASGTFAWFSHGPERAAAFLPWLVLAVELCRTDRRGIALLAVALAGAIYAGWPETAYLDGLLVAVWSLARLATKPDRIRLVVRLGSGLAIGAALAAPGWWPFVAYAASADLGSHVAMATLALPREGMAMLLLPYIDGPLAGLGRTMWHSWGTVGGYIGVAPVMLGFAGLAGQREAGLRRALAAWIVFLLLRTGGWGPAVALTRLIPLVSATELPRYIVASLGFGCTVLTCLTLDDWWRRSRPPNATLAVAIGLAAIGLAVWADGPMARLLWVHRPYRILFAASIGAALAVVGVMGWALSRAPRPAIAASLLGAMVLEASGAYLFARLGAPIAGHLDLRPAQRLAAEAGLARVITAPGGLGLNENAEDGFAQVDETMLPVPRAWSDYVTTRLHGDPIQFTHTDPIAAWLGRDWPALRALGVGWLITPAGEGPANALATAPADAPRHAIRLPAGDALTGTLPSGLPGKAPVTTIGVDIGTYSGLADGHLRLTLQGDFGSAQAEADLAGATDDAALNLLLDRPVPAGVPLRWRLTHVGGQVPIAIWVGAPADTPRFSTAAPLANGLQPELAYRVGTKEIYRLPGAAPYWQTTCTLGQATRTAAELGCAAPTSLLRRELFFSGWHATVNGAPAPIRQDGLFQRIDLPAGKASVRFVYAPPGIGWATAALGLGLALTVVLAMPGRRREGQARPGALPLDPAGPHSAQTL